MKQFSQHCIEYQRGVAAIEFALVAPVMIALLACTLFFGRVFWHYNIALKAAHDGATVLALARKIEIGVAKPDSGELEIANLARAVANAELQGLNTGNGAPAVIDVHCDSLQCIGNKIPTQVSVNVRMKVIDPYFPILADEIGAGGGIWLQAEVRVPYAGF